MGVFAGYCILRDESPLSIIVFPDAFTGVWTFTL